MIDTAADAGEWAEVQRQALDALEAALAASDLEAARRAVEHLWRDPVVQGRAIERLLWGTVLERCSGGRSEPLLLRPAPDPGLIDPDYRRYLDLLLAYQLAVIEAGRANNPACQHCGRNDRVAPVVYGYPSGVACEAARRGWVRLAGCVVEDVQRATRGWSCEGCRRFFLGPQHRPDWRVRKRRRGKPRQKGVFVFYESEDDGPGASPPHSRLSGRRRARADQAPRVEPRLP